MSHSPDRSVWSNLADAGFRHLEHAAYIVLGVLLAGAALMALLNAATTLGQAVFRFGDTETIVNAVDGLLFVFMLIEILHTVRASLRSGALKCEPFLVVGLIASIRRVLVITLETSRITGSGNFTPQNAALMRSAMVELGIMAGLILAMVISIYLLHRATPEAEEPAGSSA